MRIYDLYLHTFPRAFLLLMFALSRTGSYRPFGFLFVLGRIQRMSPHHYSHMLICLWLFKSSTISNAREHIKKVIQEASNGVDSSTRCAAASVTTTPHFTLAKILQQPSPAVKEHIDLAFWEISSCPVTFIYDLPEYWDFEVPLASMGVLHKVILGQRCSVGVRNINQFSLLLRLIFRLKTSSRCTITTDPHKADIFMVPLFPKPKPARRICNGFTIEDLEGHLTHFTAETAHKHFIVLQKGHRKYDNCGSWWKQPTGLFRKVIRIAYSLPWRSKDAHEYGPPRANLRMLDTVARESGSFLNDSVAYPHLYSVPYPASRELWGANASSAEDEISERPFLLHFGGGFHGVYGLELRKKIVSDCRKADKQQCLVQKIRKQTDVCALLRGKRQSKFCFEPGGDSPYRKSLYDSISLGCVPVLLSPYQLLVSPWHLGHFRNFSTVFLDRDDFLTDNVNIFKFLEGLVRTGDYDRMRDVLSAQSHSIQYALEDHPGDAVERLLLGVQRASRQYEQQTGI